MSPTKFTHQIDGIHQGEASTDLYEFVGDDGVYKRLRMFVDPSEGKVSFQVLKGGFDEGRFETFDAAKARYNAI
jgi:hypothetical protein